MPGAPIVVVVVRARAAHAAAGSGRAHVGEKGRNVKWTFRRCEMKRWVGYRPRRFGNAGAQRWIATVGDWRNRAA